MNKILQIKSYYSAKFGTWPGVTPVICHAGAVSWGLGSCLILSLYSLSLKDTKLKLKRCLTSFLECRNVQWLSPAASWGHRALSAVELLLLLPLLEKSRAESFSSLSGCQTQHQPSEIVLEYSPRPMGIMPVFNSSYKDKPTFLFVTLTLPIVDKPGTQRNLPSSCASENQIIKVEYFTGPLKESLLGCTLCCLTVQNWMALAHHKRDVQPTNYYPWVDNPTLVCLLWVIFPQNSACQGPSSRSSISPTHSATADELKARPVLSGALLSDFCCANEPVWLLPVTKANVYYLFSAIIPPLSQVLAHTDTLVLAVALCYRAIHKGYGKV